jgi:sugar fermentation stimulation protein A
MLLPELAQGFFLRRDNRFLATVIVDGQEAWAHVPNSGRLTDLFVPARPVWLAEAANPNRKTAFDLKLVELPSALVSVDARLPNPLFAEGVKTGELAGFNYPKIEREVTVGRNRIDFRLTSALEVCWVEAKSVTLVEDGVARFPDAATGRGSKHLRELVALRRAGDRAAVVFVIQRSDARVFIPDEQTDPVFAATLRDAAAAGVDVRAYTCQVSRKTISIMDEIPVRLSVG